jgi:hypothetical protein
VIYSQDQGVTWAQYQLSGINYFNYTVTKGGYLAGYGYTPDGIQKVVLFQSRPEPIRHHWRRRSGQG